MRRLLAVGQVRRGRDVGGVRSVDHGVDRDRRGVRTVASRSPGRGTGGLGCGSVTGGVGTGPPRRRLRLRPPDHDQRAEEGDRRGEQQGLRHRLGEPGVEELRQLRAGGGLVDVATTGDLRQVDGETAGDQGGDGRAAEHRTDLTRGVEDARAGPRLVHREVAGGGRRDRPPDARHRDAHEGARDEQPPDGHIRGQHPRVEEQRDREEQEARRGDVLRVDLVDQATHQRREHAGEHGGRREHQGRLGRRETADGLEVEHERQRHAGDGEADGRDRTVREREVAVAEQRERQQRLLLVHRLPDHERDQHDDARDDEPPDADRAPDDAPVVGAALLDAEDEEEHADGRQDDAQDVEAVRVRRELRHETHREDERDDADGHVDEEDPLPAEGVDQDTAEQRADQGRDAGDGAPQTHGRTAAVGREDAGDDRHRLRRHECRAEALHDAGGDQHPDAAAGHVAGEPAPGGGQREDHEADQVDVLRAEPVAEAAGDEQGHGVGEQVRAGDPDDRVVVGAEVEPLHDGGVGHRHDGGVDEDHEEPDDQGPEGRPGLQFSFHGCLSLSAACGRPRRSLPRRGRR